MSACAVVLSLSGTLAMASIAAVPFAMMHGDKLDVALGKLRTADLLRTELARRCGYVDGSDGTTHQWGWWASPSSADLHELDRLTAWRPRPRPCP